MVYGVYAPEYRMQPVIATMNSKPSGKGKDSSPKIAEIKWNNEIKWKGANTADAENETPRHKIQHRKTGRKNAIRTYARSWWTQRNGSSGNLEEESMCVVLHRITLPQKDDTVTELTSNLWFKITNTSDVLSYITETKLLTLLKPKESWWN